MTVSFDYTPTPAVLTCKEGSPTSKVCSARITPRVVTLTFVEEEQFRRERPGVLGYAMYGTNPCQIVLPAGGEIEIDVKQGTAYSKAVLPGPNKQGHADENTIIHEIMHCLVGPWHPDLANLSFNIDYYLRHVWRGSNFYDKLDRSADAPWMGKIVPHDFRIEPPRLSSIQFVNN